MFIYSRISSDHSPLFFFLLSVFRADIHSLLMSILRVVPDERISVEEVSSVCSDT